MTSGPLVLDVIALLSFVFGISFRSSVGAGFPCPPNRPPIQCGIPPCKANPPPRCPNYPQAQCQDYVCGTCTARFFIGSQEVTLGCYGNILVAGTDAVFRPGLQPPITYNSGGSAGFDALVSCPKGITPIQCPQPPCSAVRCPKYPSATCLNDYCGTCMGRFFDHGMEVTDNCYEHTPPSLLLLPGQFTALGTTLVYPYPDAKAGQPPFFSQEPRPLASDMPLASALCPGGITPPATCSMLSCRGLVCPQFPDAICTEDPCSESRGLPRCAPKFMLGSTEVTEICFPPRRGMGICPGGIFKIVCSYPPCEYRFCPGYPTARCYEDSCGLCSARYFVSSTEVTSLCYSGAK